MRISHIKERKTLLDIYIYSTWIKRSGGLSRHEGQNGKQYQTLTINSTMIIVREPISRFHTYIMGVASSCSVLYDTH
jgi:hypothetical protein